MTMYGTIKRMTEKGFGFIATTDGTEYFFHQSACAGTPFDELKEGPRGLVHGGPGSKGSPRRERQRALTLAIVHGPMLSSGYTSPREMARRVLCVLAPGIQPVTAAAQR